MPSDVRTGSGHGLTAKVESHERQFVDISDPAYTARERQDLNHPPTGVNGIRLEASPCVHQTAKPLMLQ